MKKSELYASISLLTIAAFLSACGDSAGTDASAQDTVADVAAGQALEVALSDSAQTLAREEEVIAAAAAELSAIPDPTVAPVVDPTAAPSLYAKAEAAQQELVKSISAIQAEYQDLLAISKNRGSFNALELAHQQFKTKVGELQKKLAEFQSAGHTFLGSEERKEYTAESQRKIVEGFEAIIQAAAQIEATLPTAVIEKEIEKRTIQLDLLKASGTEGLFSRNFGDSLRKKIETVSTLKFDRALPGHQIKFMPLVTKDAKEDDALKRVLIQQLFGQDDMVKLIRDGNLDAVAAKVYTDVVSPRMALEFVHKLGTVYNDTTYYTFAEIEEIIKHKGSDDAATLALAGKTDVEGLNGKPYPIFDNKAGKNRTMPELASVKALETEVDLKVSELIQKFLLENNISQQFFPLPAAAALSSGSIKDLSGGVSFRDARTSLTGRVDGRGLSVNGVAGQAVDLGMPLFVSLKGDVSGAKATEAATGSVAYRLGNTVIGAIQGYANSGEGFGLEGRQLESSVVASHSFGGLFIEGQAGSVSAANVHNSDWNGVRSQLTIGLDTSFVSPFVQISHRQLDRDGIHQLNETAGYVGLDMEVANLAADTYSFNTRLLTKVGYGEKSWSNGSKDLGSTSGVRGSVEWTGGMNLNSGISFSTNLGLDTLSGSSAGLKVSLER
jgi:hypothetical protein